MRQLLAIGCALVHNPSLLFFDEPTVGLDPVHRQQIWNLLYDLSNEGKTIFVTTHYMDEAERCTEVGFIEDWTAAGESFTARSEVELSHRLLEIDVDPLNAGAGSTAGPSRTPRRFTAQRQPAPLRGRTRAVDGRDGARRWPFNDLHLLGERWVEPDMEDAFTAYSQGYDERFEKIDSMKWLSFEATGSVAYKEFLHILRDRRVLLLVLTLPPLFTLLFGHAFETSELTGVKKPAH